MAHGPVQPAACFRKYTELHWMTAKLIGSWVDVAALPIPRQRGVAAMDTEWPENLKYSPRGPLLQEKPADLKSRIVPSSRLHKPPV